jgi:SprT protein
MRHKILNKVEECFKIAELHLNRKLPRPNNIIFKRSGVVGGYSNYSKKEMMFQLDFAENNPDYLNKIVPHEVAHYIQRFIYGYYYKNGKKIKSHGPEWKYIMKDIFKLKPEVSHSYDPSITINKCKKTYLYSCKCYDNIHNVSSIIHNKIQKSINNKSDKKYKRVCIKCNSEIKLMHNELDNILDVINELDSMINKIKNCKSIKH